MPSYTVETTAEQEDALTWAVSQPATTENPPSTRQEYVQSIITVMLNKLGISYRAATAEGDFKADERITAALSRATPEQKEQVLGILGLAPVIMTQGIGAPAVAPEAPAPIVGATPAPTVSTFTE